jgi:hypothetical protein
MKTGARGGTTMTRKKQYTARRAPVEERKRKPAPRWTSGSAFTKGSTHSPGSVLAPLFGGLLVALLIGGFVLVFVMGRANTHTTTASGGTPTMTVPVGYGSRNHAKGPCGNAGQAACPQVQPGWFPISSESASAVAGAISHSPDFLAMQGRFGFVAMDTPALVYAFAAHTGIVYYDDAHWVVSVRCSSGLRCGLFDFVYDRAAHALRFSSFGVITPADPHSTMAFPYMPASEAVRLLQKQRGLQAMPGAQPELIFFPINPNFPVITSPVHQWKGGGNSPMIPMWLVVGSDGQNYFVGTDQHVYTRQALPVATGRP